MTTNTAGDVDGALIVFFSILIATLKRLFFLGFRTTTIIINIMINTLGSVYALEIKACNTCRVTLGLFSLSACLAHDRYFCTDKYHH